MSEILDAGVDFVASTTRWAGNANRMVMQGTLWYGIMCRSFLLLERMLRLSLNELSPVADTELREASRTRANGKPLRAMTFGQCVGTLEELAPILPELLSAAHPSLLIRRNLLPDEDRKAWKRIVSLRNRMAHSGPGFFDAVDLRSGRIWRRCELKEPLDQQAKDVWGIGRQFCHSPFILTCIALQGVEEETAKAKLLAAETKCFELQELAKVGEQAIDAFHAA